MELQSLGRELRNLHFNKVLVGLTQAASMTTVQTQPRTVIQGKEWPLGIILSHPSSEGNFLRPLQGNKAVCKLKRFLPKCIS